MRIILVLLVVSILMVGITAAAEGKPADFSEELDDEDIRDPGHVNPGNGNPGHISPAPSGGGNGGGGAPGWLPVGSRLAPG